MPDVFDDPIGRAQELRIEKSNAPSVEHRRCERGERAKKRR
jgi:hypothetical protein